MNTDENELEFLNRLFKPINIKIAQIFYPGQYFGGAFATKKALKITPNSNLAFIYISGNNTFLLAIKEQIQANLITQSLQNFYSKIETLNFNYLRQLTQQQLKEILKYFDLKKVQKFETLQCEGLQTIKLYFIMEGSFLATKIDEVSLSKNVQLKENKLIPSEISKIQSIILHCRLQLLEKENQSKNLKRKQINVFTEGTIIGEEYLQQAQLYQKTQYKVQCVSKVGKVLSIGVSTFKNLMKQYDHPISIISKSTANSLYFQKSLKTKRKQNLRLNLQYLSQQQYYDSRYGCQSSRQSSEKSMSNVLYKNNIQTARNTKSTLAHTLNNYSSHGQQEQPYFF